MSGVGHDLNGIPLTADDEWDEEELIGLVMDACYKVCAKQNADIETGVNVAWHDMGLLHPINLCQRVIDNDLTSIYDNNSGLDGFEQWVSDRISAVVGENRYKHYVK